jgi:hypothetical protein
MAFTTRTAMLGLLTVTCAAALTSCKSNAPAPVQVPSVPFTMAEPATLTNDLTLSAEFRPYQEVEVMA